MKNLRSAGELLDHLDAEISWRRKEVIELRALAGKAKEKKADLFVRAGIALVYAHWEGFVKNAANAYINYLANRKERTRSMTDCFIALSVKSKIANMGESGKSLVAVEAVNHLLSVLDMPVELPRTGISAESNLNSDVFRNIAGWVGIDAAPYSTRFALLDETLLASRNKIAHGEFLTITPQRFETLAQEIFEMMEWFKTDIENAVACSSFLRPALPAVAPQEG